jgi:hypothetical protein
VYMAVSLVQRVQPFSSRATMVATAGGRDESRPYGA